MNVDRDWTASHLPDLKGLDLARRSRGPEKAESHDASDGDGKGSTRDSDMIPEGKADKRKKEECRVDNLGIWKGSKAIWSQMRCRRTVPTTRGAIPA